VATVLTVKTAATRGSQLIARDAGFQLRFDDLLGNVTANFDYSFIIDFTRFRNSQHVLSRRERRQNNSTRATNTSITFVIDVHLSA
jgi:hypothetical protein